MRGFDGEGLDHRERTRWQYVAMGKVREIGAGASSINGTGDRAMGGILTHDVNAISNTLRLMTTRGIEAYNN
jgi:hypothetical protein